MSDTTNPLIQQQIDEAAKLASVPPPPEAPEEIVINQDHKRSRISPSALISLLFLLFITLPLGGFYLSQKKPLTEVRSRAAIPLPKPTLLKKVKPPVATPSSKPANALAYERLNKTYFGQYVNDLSVLKARVWNVFVADKLIHGTVFLKYDDTLDKTFIFSRLQGLVPVTKKAFHLWLVKNNRFSQAGVIDVADEDGVSTGYSSFEQTGDFRNYAQLIISHDASESAKPQSTITTLEVSNSKL